MTTFAYKAGKDLAITHEEKVELMKEAFAKRTGEGLSRGFASLDFAPCALCGAFNAFGCDFRVWSLCGAVMTVCGAGDSETLREVTPQMLKAALLPQKQG